ncbi:hypothetical protein NIES2101_00905 [Calothrix sp. HK-06]|nr:hypothetical protein NIES2101_00905 [Calothrix sp. HK-06]
MPKPTILLALDPYSAAFATAIKRQLQKSNTPQSSLIQTYTLTWDGQAFNFNSELEAYADMSFELTQTPNNSVSQIRTQFTQSAGKLQTELIEVLKSATQSPEAIAAKRQGMEISNAHRIYLMLSASNHKARAVVFELVRLIRWLYSKYFTDVPHSLEALLLLPGLFSNVTTVDYSATYGLLKELDYKMTTGVVVAGSQKAPPFDNCWLIDERIGALKDNLCSYADAFAGFLTVEAETSGLLIGAQKVRGKMPAYSAFGYGELFFPGETVINRLSASLGADIIVEQFLPKPEFTPENKRKWLLDAKEFVLSEEFSNAFLELERDNGKPVWQDFNPRLDIRTGMANEYGMELQRAYRQFQNKELLSYKRALENSCKQVQATLTNFLDNTINRYADANESGLHEAVMLLNRMTYLYLELQTDEARDQSHNLVTELRGTEAFFDTKLQVVIDNEATKKLLNEVLSLKLRQQQLQDNISEGNHQELQQLQTILEQLRAATEEYQKAANAEIESANQIRVAARKQARQEAEAAILATQKHLTVTENQLETITDKLTELLAEESRFRNQHLVIYPIFFVISLFGFFIFIGIFNQSILWGLLQKIGENLVNCLLWTAVAILTYLGIVWLQYSTNIRDRIQKTQKQIKRLESSLKATAVELRRNYNDQLKLEYDFYVQNLRVETLNYLIKTAKQKADSLRQTLDTFAEIYNNLLQQRKRATTKFSETRLAVVTDKDIDNYYQNFIESSPTKTFTQECVSRSQSWKMSATFEHQLTSFTQKQFGQLSNVSIREVLLSSHLMAPNTASLRLNQLHDSANLLLRLQDIDANLNPTSQRETTLWVSAKDKEQILGLCSRSYRTLTALVAEDEQKLCVLTRSLGFPAYFLSQIEFYRDCYERTQSEQLNSNEDNIPDLIPDEIGSNRELIIASSSLLLAIALGIVSQHQGEYKFKGQSLGKDREQIALALASEFTFQELYEEIRESIEAFEHDLIYQKLQKLGDTLANELTRNERKMLDNLKKEYNPLN